VGAAAHVISCSAVTTEFPFGPEYVESMALPGEQGAAHLYRGGLFCSQTVRRAEPWGWWSSDVRTRVLSTHDESTLQRWFQRALTAETLGQVFEQ